MIKKLNIGRENIKFKICDDGGKTLKIIPIFLKYTASIGNITFNNSSNLTQTIVNQMYAIMETTKSTIRVLNYNKRFLLNESNLKLIWKYGEPTEAQKYHALMKRLRKLGVSV